MIDDNLLRAGQRLFAIVVTMTAQKYREDRTIVCSVGLTNVEALFGKTLWAYRAPTHRIKIIGQMSVFCSIFVIQFQYQFLYTV